MEQNYILQLIKDLNEKFDVLSNESRNLYLNKESFNIYWNTVERDLRNLGDKIRSLENRTVKLVSDNAQQDIKSAKMSVKVGFIIGSASLITGALLGILANYFF